MCAIYPDEDMPVDDYGVRADIIGAPEATYNRMNISQFYAQFLSLLARIVYNRMMACGNDKLTAYKEMLRFYDDVNPEYATVVAEVGKTDKDKIALVDDFLANRYLFLVVPPFLDRVRTDWVLYMLERYEAEKYITPIEYNLRDRDGNFLRRVRTRRPVLIGNKYVFLLCKVPICKACGMGYINQWGIPITVKNTDVKNLSPIALTAIRAGEDEVRNLITNIGSVQTARILHIYANAPQASEKLGYTLLTNDHPSQLPWLDETQMSLTQKSRCIQILNSITSAIGIDLTHPIAADDEVEYCNNIENCLNLDAEEHYKGGNSESSDEEDK